MGMREDAVHPATAIFIPTWKLANSEARESGVEMERRGSVSSKHVESTEDTEWPLTPRAALNETRT